MDYLLGVGLVLFPVGVVVCYFYTRRVIGKGVIVLPAVERGDIEHTYYKNKEPKSFWRALAFQNTMLMFAFSIPLVMWVVMLLNE